MLRDSLRLFKWVFPSLEYFKAKIILNIILYEPVITVFTVCIQAWENSVDSEEHGISSESTLFATHPDIKMGSKLYVQILQQVW